MSVPEKLKLGQAFPERVTGGPHMKKEFAEDVSLVRSAAAFGPGVSVVPVLGVAWEKGFSRPSGQS